MEYQNITLLLHYTTVLDGMLFRGLLPLTKLGFTAVDAFVTHYTKLACTAFLLWMV